MNASNERESIDLSALRGGRGEQIIHFIATSNAGSWPLDAARFELHSSGQWLGTVHPIEGEGHTSVMLHLDERIGIFLEDTEGAECCLELQTRQGYQAIVIGRDLLPERIPSIANEVFALACEPILRTVQ